MPPALRLLPPLAVLTLAVVCVLAASPLAARAAEAPGGAARPGFDACRGCHFEIKRQLKKANGHAPFRTGQCDACHNPHAAPNKGLVKRDVGELCLGCHPGPEHEPSNVHEPFGRGDCLSCHDPHASDNPGRLKAAGSELCFGCHERDGAFDARHGHTPARRGECLTCHSPHGSDQPALVRRPPEKLCASCHSVAPGIAGHGGRNVAGADCMSCHNPHGSQRGGLVRATLHEPYGDKQCAACHGKGRDAARTGAAACLSCHQDVAGRFGASASHVGRGDYCLSCHSPHASDRDHMLRAGQRRVCLGCHKDTAGRLSEISFARRHPLVDQGKCSACHEPHGSNERFMLRQGGVKSCLGCHERHATFTHPVGAQVTDPRSKGDITCITCHGLMGSENEYVLRFDRRKELCIQCHKGY